MNQQVESYGQVVKQYIGNLPKGDGDWLSELRQKAAKRFAGLGFPHAKLETWKYTGIDGLLSQEFEVDDTSPEYAEHTVLQQFLQEPVSGRLVFVDGVYQADLSHCESAGVSIGSLHAAMVLADSTVLKKTGSLSGVGEHGFAAMNLATVHDGAVIHIAADTELKRPIELLHVTTRGAEGKALRSRHLIVVEAGTSANLVERYVALDDTTYFNNTVCELFIEEGAKLTHQRVQLESTQAYHMSDLHLELKANAHYHGIYAAIGAAWSRTSVHNRFSDQNANCELDGLYMADNGQLTDFHLDVDHAVPHCDSRENFRGVLHGAGKAVFDGLIQVREQAQKSNANLHNANLVLSRRAEVDTKPQLVILADDVQCSHGTTVGQLDPEAVYYLRSRGLSEREARRLLCLGFASEIIDRFESETLRLQLTEVIRQRIQG
ncbi:MAG: Fe-S cluster assembly protein SufD [Candidatus Thiodiazotropha sp. (ex Monitilora ramsayi)]|nr:Fe-S cluster assembly protein SufD [Candidatus Thiodiazotropha sp. (ex Monitilora ramsayi)]